MADLTTDVHLGEPPGEPTRGALAAWRTPCTMYTVKSYFEKHKTWKTLVYQSSLVESLQPLNIKV